MRRLFARLPSAQGERVLLRGLKENDAEGLGALTRQSAVYRYLPTFLFEKAV